MGFFVDIGAIAAGLALGGVLGYRIGLRWREKRRVLWTVGSVAFVSAGVLNLAGQITGQEWLAIGSLGLMAGLISGTKYGGFPEVRIWDKPPTKLGQ